MMMPARFGRFLVQQIVLQALLVLGIFLFGFLLVGENYVRWDLTEDRRFSISEASYKIAQELEDTLTIKAYFNAEVPPMVEPLQRQVFDILEEYEANSNGKIKVERYDPGDSHIAESEAKAANIAPVRLQILEATSQSAVLVYGGIVLIYRDRKSEEINIASRYAQGYEGLSVLEYEITSRIWQLTHEKPKLGLTGYLETVPPPAQFGQPPQQPRNEFQTLRRVLGDAFEIKNVNLKEEEPKPEEIPLLLVVRPREFSDVEVFRLDQYLMKGGRAILCVTKGELNMSPYTRQWAFKSFPTGLDEWLAFQGIRIPEEFVLHYRSAAMTETTVETQLGQMRVPVPNHFWPKISEPDSLDRENPAIGTLRSILFFWPHPVDVIDSKVGAKSASVLVRSHGDDSWRLRNTSKADLGQLQKPDFPQSQTDLKSSPLAVALEGKFQSYYATNPVPPSLTPAKKEGEEEEPAGPEVVKESVQPTNLVVIGNAIFISDPALGGGQGGDDAARSASLLALNLVDWLARSRELIALRAKRYTDRALESDIGDDMDELREKAEAGEMTATEFVDEADRLRDRQKERRKVVRWMVILWPCAIVVFAGLLVWICRAAFRSSMTPPPFAIPPEGLGEEESQ